MLLLLLVEHRTEGVGGRGRQCYPVGKRARARVVGRRSRLVGLHDVRLLESLEHLLTCQGLQEDFTEPSDKSLRPG